MPRHKTQPVPGALRAVLPRLRRGQRLGKYKILKRLGEGGYAEVYSALDTVEEVRVALKIPRGSLITADTLESFYQEVRLAARLHHPNILALKNADMIEGRFVAVTALGEETLGDRLKRRLATRQALEFAEQVLDAVAFAHEKGIIHCDIKPENVILFPGGVVRLTDFGIAKVTMRTVSASGSGTVGYVAPEQAMGRPSRRSDVFSLGLLVYRTLSGELPKWPFEWPPPGYRRIRRRVAAPFVAVLARALEVDPRRRFADAGKMLAAFRSAKRSGLAARPRPRSARTGGRRKRGWRSVQRREFQRRLGRLLETRYACAGCGGPVSEAMTTCPWCRADRKIHSGETSFPSRCPRCRRGLKLDWRFCPWCYGAGFEPHGRRSYTDRRYSARCANPGCSRKSLMPFMRYCPWCRRKVRKPWKIPGDRRTCSGCGWGIAGGFWSFCPWCSKATGES